MHLLPYFDRFRVEAILITNLYNVRFLTGFTGTNGLVFITRKHKYFITDFRYTEQAKKQVKGYAILDMKEGVTNTLLKLIKKHHATQLGFEAGQMNYTYYSALKKKLKGIMLVPMTHDPGELRQVKNQIEIGKIKKACAVNKRAFEKIRHHITPGKTEIQIARTLEVAMLAEGAEKIGFDTIVASGWRGSLPHGVASTKKLRKGEMVTIDFGCVYEGYNSDETVTICLGKSDKKQEIIHKTVFEAQRRAIGLAKPGVKCSDLDKAARDYISEKGYGKYFGHALGHGVGLEVHERPVLSPNSEDVLEEGMVFTIEPGIYIPNFGGVRLEDVFVCTKSGVKKLTKIDKQIFAY